MKDAAETSAQTRVSPNEIIQQHEKLIAHVARSFVVPGVQLDDLMQIGRLTLFNVAQTWRGDASLWTYAKRSIVRDMIRFVSSELGHAGAGEVGDDVANDSSSPEEVMDRAQCVSIVSQEFPLLSEGERRVVRMRFVEELDVRVIAGQLGFSKSEVDRIYHGAIDKLRERVGSKL